MTSALIFFISGPRLCHVCRLANSPVIAFVAFLLCWSIQIGIRTTNVFRIPTTDVNKVQDNHSTFSQVKIRAIHHWSRQALGRVLNRGMHRFFSPPNLIIAICICAHDIPRGIVIDNKVLIETCPVVVDERFVGGTVAPVKDALIRRQSDHEAMVTPTLAADGLTWVDGGAVAKSVSQALIITIT